MPRHRLRPHDAHAAAVSTITEWGQQAEYAYGDGAHMDEHTVLAVSSGRLSSLAAKILAKHPPVWQDGVFVCPACVQIHGSVMVRVEYPCQAVWDVMEETLGPDEEPAAPRLGLQLVVQDGPEPYLSDAAAELELTHRLDPGPARAYAAAVIAVLTGSARRD